MAMTFVEVDERGDWRAIVKLTKQDIPIVDGHPYQSTVPMNVTPPAGTAQQKVQQRGREHRSGGGHRRRR
jgi:hypothetical protein